MKIGLLCTFAFALANSVSNAIRPPKVIEAITKGIYQVETLTGEALVTAKYEIADMVQSRFPGRTNRTQKDILSDFEKQWPISIVLKQKGKIVGNISCYSKNPYYFIHSLASLSDQIPYRGVGLVLLNCLLDELRKEGRGIKDVYAILRKENKPAISTFEKSGFTWFRRVQNGRTVYGVYWLRLDDSLLSEYVALE